MKKVEEALLWQYIEGTCSEMERQQVEAALQSDTALRQEYLERKQLHDLLKQTEAEQPSLRFAQNIMERLPQMYSALLREPLLQKRWWKIFVGSIGSIAAAVTVFLLTYDGPVGELSLPLVGRVDKVTNKVITDTSPDFLLIFSLTTVSIVLLFALDRYLKSKLDRGRQTRIS